MITISVVIPCYNRAGMIVDAIASVRAQTRAAAEVIVVDDASSDESASIAAANNARVIRLAGHAGIPAARNAGIRAAKSDAIAWLDSDDYWEPGHLATVGALLDEHPDAAVAAAAMRLTGMRSGVWYGRVPEGPPAEVLEAAFHATAVHTSAALVRKDALVAVGGYDETEPYGEDFDLWLRLARKYKFVATRSVTANYRWHGAQVSVQPIPPLLATYRYRRRVLDSVLQDGESDVAERLSAAFRGRWAADLQDAWERHELGLLRALLELAPIVPDIPADLTRKWSRRARIPAVLAKFLRGARSRLSPSQHPPGSRGD